MSAMRKVGILGGMGPAAGVDYVRMFLGACEAHLHARGETVRDQAYPEHWIVQVPAPDRTAALLDGGLSPLPSMTRALLGLQHEGVATAAIACNTAHAWHAQMQRECPGIELLHIVQETTAQLAREGITSIARSQHWAPIASASMRMRYATLASTATCRCPTRRRQ
jgi:aspartate racemase